MSDIFLMPFCSLSPSQRWQNEWSSAGRVWGGGLWGAHPPGRENQKQQVLGAGATLQTLEVEEKEKVGEV